MTVTIKFDLGAINGPAELYPGVDDLEQSVALALEDAIDNGNMEALQWLTDNTWRIQIV